MVEDQPVDPERLECLRKASPEEKTDIVLALIEEHGKLELPEVKLWRLDLSQETIRRKRRKWQGVGEPPWWDARRRCAYLEKPIHPAAALTASPVIRPS